MSTNAPANRCYAQTSLQLDAQLAADGWKQVDRRAIANAYDLARRLFSARFRPSGKTFLAHLIGTASIAAAHASLAADEARPEDGSVGRDLALVQTALLHAAYVQGDFGDGPNGDGAARRRELSEVLGEDGELLVNAFTNFSWRPWLTPRVARGAAPTGRVQDLDEDGRAILFLGACNALEDTLDGALGRFSEAKTRSTLRQVAAATDLARQLGHLRLADELQAALEAAPSAPPGALDKSFTVAPRSMRPRRRLRLFGKRSP